MKQKSKKPRKPREKKKFKNRVKTLNLNHNLDFKKIFQKSLMDFVNQSRLGSYICNLNERYGC